jgi:hypothetical protein
MRDEIDFGGGLIELELELNGLSLQEVGDLEGSPLDAEVRELLSDAGSGHGLTAGFQPTSEARATISASRKGRPLSSFHPLMKCCCSQHDRRLGIWLVV